METEQLLKEKFPSLEKELIAEIIEVSTLKLNTSREVISHLLLNLEIRKHVITERNSIDYSVLVRK
jgi:hypothetical protein